MSEHDSDQRWREESEREREDQHVHVHLHFEGPIVINVVPQQAPRRRAESATLMFQSETGVDTMAGKITVDQGGKVKLSFSDDKGDTDAAAPEGNGSGVVYSYTSSDETTATVAQDPANPLEGDVTGVKEGTGVLISASILNGDGSAVLEPDGVTPFTVEPVSVDVGAGNAVSASLAQE